MSDFTMDAVSSILGLPPLPTPEPTPAPAVNYVTLAENLLGAEWRNGDVAVAQVTEAHVYATLALAEQQRIANLIAFEVISGEKNRAEIRKGLGL
jgi:hypothetical protein